MPHRRFVPFRPVWALACLLLLPFSAAWSSAQASEPHLDYPEKRLYDPGKYTWENRRSRQVWQPADAYWVSESITCRTALPCNALRTAHETLWLRLYDQLKDWIDLALQFHAPLFTPREIGWLQEIRKIHDPWNRLEFLEDESRFQLDPASPHRIAITELKPGSTIYLNKKYFDSLSFGKVRALKTPSKEVIGTYLGILIHEMGHHLGIPDSPERELDQLGAKLKQIFLQATETIDLGSHNQPQLRLIAMNSSAKLDMNPGPQARRSSRIFWLGERDADTLELTEALRRGLELQHQSQEVFVTDYRVSGLHWETIEPRWDLASYSVPVTAQAQVEYVLWEKDAATRKFRSSIRRAIAHLSLWLDISGGKPLKDAGDWDIQLAATRPWGNSAMMVAVRFTPWEDWASDLEITRLDSEVTQSHATTFEGILKGSLSGEGNLDDLDPAQVKARIIAPARSDLGVIPALDSIATGKIIRNASGGEARLEFRYELPLSAHANKYRVTEVLLGRKNGQPPLRILPTFVSEIASPPAPPVESASQIRLLEMSAGTELWKRGDRPFNRDYSTNQLHYPMKGSLEEEPVARLNFKIVAPRKLLRLLLTVKAENYSDAYLDDKSAANSEWPVKVPLENPLRKCTTGLVLDLLHPENSPLVAGVRMTRDAEQNLVISVDLQRIGEFNGYNGVNIVVRDLYVLDDQLNELYEPVPMVIEPGII